jgi:hypothetical protein
VRAELGKDRMTTLRALAAAARIEPESLAARWLDERLAAEWVAYERQ